MKLGTSSKLLTHHHRCYSIFKVNWWAFIIMWTRRTRWGESPARVSCRFTPDWSSSLSPNDCNFHNTLLLGCAISVGHEWYYGDGMVRCVYHDDGGIKSNKKKSWKVDENGSWWSNGAFDGIRESWMLTLELCWDLSDFFAAHNSLHSMWFN